MIRLETNLPEFWGELCEVIRLFLGPVEIRQDEGDRVIRHEHLEQNGQWIERFTAGDRSACHAAPIVWGGLAEKRQLKRAAKTGCFLLMRQLTGIAPPWGSLTGIRPTRLMYELRAQGVEGEAAERAMQETFFVSPEKTRLLSDILAMQRGLIDTPDNEYDLYIGIPFCTTRCAYCSFASGELGKGLLVEPYLAALKREMALDAALMKELGLSLRSAYMGGGTPTALTAVQLDGLLKEANRLFPGAREWTVEAGRPDTIDRDKLQSLLDNGVERISVNPQTFSDETLRVIGRAHTARQTMEAYELARRMGFHHINMDLIAALPGEDEAAFMRSLARTIELAPESVTVHTLAIKRSSRLHEQGYVQADADAAARMVDGA
ncbi:MAG: coproporphyrinogen dehydrogenase HemZ, partial [Clostridia bacterium]|nr:coproporphyrinogen dehydrogenase HemZ [Clostridia bacterium]